MSAYIDIGTKDYTGKDFFSISLNTGGKVKTLGGNFYQMDRNGSLLKTPSLDRRVLNLELSDFENYVKTRDIFGTGFAISKKHLCRNLVEI